MAQNDQALSFNGTDQFVTLGAADALGLRGTDFTVEAWIKIGAARLDGVDLTIIGSDASTQSAGFCLSIKNGRPYFGFSGAETAGNTSLIAGTWLHVAFR